MRINSTAGCGLGDPRLGKKAVKRSELVDFGHSAVDCPHQQMFCNDCGFETTKAKLDGHIAECPAAIERIGKECEGCGTVCEW